tara:strand:- start:532 stop:768 length:237 start_codon:yes stop_codon:yes gene_type:complete
MGNFNSKIHIKNEMETRLNEDFVGIQDVNSDNNQKKELINQINKLNKKIEIQNIKIKSLQYEINVKNDRLRMYGESIK